jgi:Cys-tRNA(Pro)/Cys-tRNA(Cys) deacylase
MSRVTPATQALSRLDIAFELRSYDYDAEAAQIGLQAAEALGESPARVFKTLVLLVDGKPACVVIPSDREVAMKKAASAFSGKAATMMPPKDAERITGYHVGGISPLGGKKRLPVRVDASALEQPYVFVNGGQRGLQIRIAPDALLRACDAQAVDLLA